MTSVTADREDTRPREGAPAVSIGKASYTLPAPPKHPIGKPAAEAFESWWNDAERTALRSGRYAGPQRHHDRRAFIAGYIQCYEDLKAAAAAGVPHG